MLRKILAFKLSVIAGLTLRRYRPRIVGITGTAGKTSTKEAIAAALRPFKRIRVSAGNLNNELGIPLTILGDWSEEYYTRGPSMRFWLKVLMVGVARLIFSRSYPEILVLEYGADKPGDMRNLVRAYPPSIGVVTAVGDIPVHVEFYAGPAEVAAEKVRLISALPVTGWAVLNYDDLSVLEMREKTHARVMTFGYAEQADVQVSHPTLSLENQYVRGISCKLHIGGSVIPVTVRGSVGRGQGYACAAAMAVAHAVGLNAVQAAQGLERYQGPAGRLRLIKGIKDTQILDDSYNASPIAVHLALETLRDIPAQRHIAVLGDMFELGRFELQAHQEIGNIAASSAQVIIGVGERARLIADAARNQLPAEAVRWFADARAAAPIVQELLRPGDVILVKGSQGMRMERIVKEIMAEPGRAAEMLVRQSESWLVKT